MGKLISLISGAILTVLGLTSGVLLILAPLGVADINPGVIVWIFFPVLTLLGYLFLAVASRGSSVAIITSVAGALLLCLGITATVVLFLFGSSMLKPASDTIGLWYVLGIGIVFGAAGLSFRRFGA